MPKKQIEIIITSVLILIFVFAGINSFKAINKSVKSKTKPSARALSVGTQKVGLAETKNKDLTKDEVSKWNRCPFSGKQYSEEATIGLGLSGIIWDGIKPQAIINSQIFSEGDSVGEYYIKKIEKQKVILTDGQRQIELNI